MTESFDNDAIVGEVDIPLVPISDLMNQSYLDYAMSVIIDRALPDVRDGLKPVHRRILYAMHNLGITPGKAHKKSARIVGDVIGKYHPHGDSAAYEAAVRMAQSWSMRVPLIDGQGNFGSRDGDSPAAMRYTEMRMSRGGEAMFADIEKSVVDFVDNYDGSEKEPVTLPTRLPQLWINGSAGIAVGMASNIPPHNVDETVQAFLAYLEDPTLSIDALTAVLPGPDFPTGGLVHGVEGFREAVETGRGKVKVRSRYHTESRKGGGSRIVITELPYQVNKAALVQELAALVNDRRVEGVVDIQDDSSKKGLQVRIDLKRDVDPDVTFNQLLSLSKNLEVTFSYNVMALVNGRPELMGLRAVFEHFRDFRLEVIERHARYEWERHSARVHILNGLIAAIESTDDTVRTIRGSDSREAAHEALKGLLGIDDDQARAILDMRLHRLTGLEINALWDEKADHEAKIAEFERLLNDPQARHDKLVEQTKAAAKPFSEARRTEIAHHLGALTDESLIAEEDVVIGVTHRGYIQRLPAGAIRTQNRNTRGKRMMNVREDDALSALYPMSTHDYLLAVTDSGQVHAVKAYRVPERSRHMYNIFSHIEGRVESILSVSEFETGDLVFVTEKGVIKRTPLAEYRNAERKFGIMGISLTEGDRVVGARVGFEGDSLLMITRNGKALRTPMTEANVRPLGRNSVGPRGMTLAGGDAVVGLAVIREGQETASTLLTVTENAFGKHTTVDAYPSSNRGTKGVLSHKIGDRTGPVVRALLVDTDQDLLILNEQGGGNRVRVADIPTMARNTAGVRLMKDNGLVTEAIAIPNTEAEEAEDEEATA